MSVTLIKNTPQPQSGYAPCACRDCMDTTVSSDITSPELCSECEDAGCEKYPFAPMDANAPHAPAWQYDCQRDDAYGA